MYKHAIKDGVTMLFFLTKLYGWPFLVTIIWPYRCFLGTQVILEGTVISEKKKFMSHLNNEANQQNRLWSYIESYFSWKAIKKKQI